MERIDLVGGAVEWWGASWLDVDPDGGVSPRRLPARYLRQVGALTALRANAACGVRLVLRTDAPELELRVRLSTLTPGVEVPSPVADLVVDGQLVDSLGPAAEPVGAPRSAGADGGRRCTFRFARPRPSRGVVELWLPHDAVVTVEALSVPAGSRVAGPGPDARPRQVHHGSSISHGGEAASPARTWPAEAARRAGARLTNLALAGECHIDQFAARTIRDLPAELITLELGVNVVNGATMVARTFTSALHGFLDTVRDGHPATPIVVVSPVAFPEAERRPGPTSVRDGRLVATGDPAAVASGALTVVRVREVIAAVLAGRVADGDPALHHVDGLRLLGAGDVGLLVDGLHPGDAGHQLIGARFATILGELAVV